MKSARQQSGQESPIDRKISSRAMIQASGVAPGKGFRQASSRARFQASGSEAKLKSMAGRHPTNEIAAELGRSAGATVMAASKLKVSLKMRPYLARPANTQTESIKDQSEDPRPAPEVPT